MKKFLITTLLVSFLFITSCGGKSPMLVAKDYVKDYFKVITNKMTPKKFCSRYNLMENCESHYQNIAKIISDNEININWKYNDFFFSEEIEKEGKALRHYTFTIDAQAQYKEGLETLQEKYYIDVAKEKNKWLIYETDMQFGELVLGLFAFNYNL